MKTKEQTIELLETIARLLEIKGENPFKIRAYTTAARTLETFSGSFQSAVTEDKLRELDGIGDAALVSQDLLGAQRDLYGGFCRQGAGLIHTVGMKTLCAAQDR